MGAFDDLIPGGGGETGAPATEAERKAASFLIRGIGAEGTYKAQNVGPRSLVGQKIADWAPNALNSLPSAIGNSARRQVADTNQDEFIAASLRQDSGAAIPEQELERQRRIYFPMPGDGPEAIQAKARARERALLGLHQSAGRLAPGALQKVRQQAASMRSKSSDGIPSGAIKYLNANPGTAAQFDAKFGKGASARYLKGQ